MQLQKTNMRNLIAMTFSEAEKTRPRFIIVIRKTEGKLGYRRLEKKNPDLKETGILTGKCKENI